MGPGASSSTASAGPLLVHRSQVLSTPRLLRTASLVLVAGIAGLGLVAAQAVAERSDSADAVRFEATPLLVGAEDLYVALADADAAASTAFLRAGLEPSELRTRYLADVDVAGRQLTALAGRPDLPGASRAAIDSIAADLPTYTGLVEAARANNRLDFPLGAAYLRRASALMRDEILPAATRVYEEGARELYLSYEHGTSEAAVIAVVVAGGAVVVLLLLTQLLVARRSHRVFNPGLAAATVLVVGLASGVVASFGAQRDSLLRSQREGSDQLLVLSTARILALRALSDENLDLIERGTDPSYLEDFAGLVSSLRGDEGTGGLLGEAAAIARRTGTERRIDEITRRHDDVLAVHQRVRELDDRAAYRQAVDVAVTEEAASAGVLDEALDGEIGAARARLDANADDAREWLRWLTSIAVVLTALAVVLVLWGLQRRMREYR